MNQQLLMVQGTTSDAGKSVLVAGICRVLKRKGVSVAPFKPQNMALNSAVTVDGGEIGRAQALQALACGIEPTTDMNPVLLKPSSDTGAQVIIHGKAVQDMEAKRFHDYKKVALNAVLESSNRLCGDYQRVIVEGAGSPAEINLRQNDIANMGFAEAVDCPVIIVADIDRGGVFAHLVGTLELLSPSEQNRVVGFVINRFRGDIRLLQSGLDWLEEKTGKPVLGVIPYLHGLYLDAEDAITTAQELKLKPEKALNVVVPVLSRISNHTDFDALKLHPSVNLTFCPLSEAPGQADLIILPGSKNVRKDLELLIKHDWHHHLNRHLRYGGKLLGICGGYQMLGRRVSDPEGVEDQPGTSPGLGYLACETILEKEKQLKRVRGTLNLGELPVHIRGYEIHCGVTQVEGKSLVKLTDGRLDGTMSADGQVAGTYLHGLFDQPITCASLLAWAGLKDAGNDVDMDNHREQQLNWLADTLEKSLDFSKLFPEEF